MSKVMISLPNSLVNRMKALIPAGERSQVLANLLKKEIETREEVLYQHALSLEKNSELRQEMQTWDTLYSDDGLENV